MAMVDTGNLASRDELSFASGRRINAYVAPEARILARPRDLLPGGVSAAVRPHHRPPQPQPLPVVRGQADPSAAAEALVSDPAVGAVPSRPGDAAAPDPRRRSERRPPRPAATGRRLRPPRARRRGRGSPPPAESRRGRPHRRHRSPSARLRRGWVCSPCCSDRVTGWLGGGAGFRPDRLSALSSPARPALGLSQPAPGQRPPPRPAGADAGAPPAGRLLGRRAAGGEPAGADPHRRPAGGGDLRRPRRRRPWAASTSSRSSSWRARRRPRSNAVSY